MRGRKRIELIEWACHTELNLGARYRRVNDERPSVALFYAHSADDWEQRYRQAVETAPEKVLVMEGKEAELVFAAIASDAQDKQSQGLLAEVQQRRLAQQLAFEAAKGDSGALREFIQLVNKPNQGVWARLDLPHSRARFLLREVDSHSLIQIESGEYCWVLEHKQNGITQCIREGGTRYELENQVVLLVCDVAYLAVDIMRALRGRESEVVSSKT